MGWLVRIKPTSRRSKIHAATDKGNVIKRQSLTQGDVYLIRPCARLLFYIRRKPISLSVDHPFMLCPNNKTLILFIFIIDVFKHIRLSIAHTNDIVHNTGVPKAHCFRRALPLVTLFCFVFPPLSVVRSTKILIFSTPAMLFCQSNSMLRFCINHQYCVSQYPLR